MIDSNDFLISNKGLLRAGEVEVGMKVLGLRSTQGSFAWSTIESVEYQNDEAIRVYGDQSEFSIFANTVVIVRGRGPVKLFGEVLSSNIYRSHLRIESASLISKGIEKTWQDNNFDTQARGEEIYLLYGVLTRRIPLRNQIVVRLPKDRYDRISHVFSSMEHSVFKGEYWDWLKIRSPILNDSIGESWSLPFSIPKTIRGSSYGKLREFYHGVMIATTEQFEGFLFHRTFEHERDIRGLMTIFLSMAGANFRLEPVPLYCPDEIVLGITEQPSNVNSIRASKCIGITKAVSLVSEHIDWYPVVNLSFLS